MCDSELRYIHTVEAKMLRLSGPGCSKLFHTKTAVSHVALHKRNSGAENGRELFKHWKDSASLVVCNEKNFLL